MKKLFVLALLAVGFNGFLGVEEKQGEEPKSNATLEDNQAYSPLYVAAEDGKLDELKALIAKGDDVNSKNGDGRWTPLHTAAYRGRAVIVEILLEHGANQNITDRFGWTPLHTAAYTGNANVIKVLLKQYANLYAKDNKGWTPLHIAAEKGYREVARLLIENGTDVNVRGQNGRTPLHVAVDHSQSGVAKLLVEKGADLNAKDDEGMTPYDLTAKKDHADFFNFVNQSNPKTPLGWILGAVALILILTISFIYVYIRLRRKNKLVRKPKPVELEGFELGNAEGINSKLALDEQADLLPYDKKYEFSREKLKLGKKLGGGAFGIVYKGVAHGILPYEDKTEVAVKMVKRMSNDEIMRALVMELKIMIHLGQHLNLVNLLGAVTKDILRYNMMIIVEHCRYGCLQNFLIDSRLSFIDQIDHVTDTIKSNLTTKLQPYQENKEYFSSESSESHQKSNSNSYYIRDENGVEHLQGRTSYDLDTSKKKMESESIPQITTIDLLSWSFQITRGMHYLASRKVLHGDLAARNILLCEDNVIKICDFGLARSLYTSEIYHKKEEALLPFKWLALECISDHKFSVRTDVWAFGITLWEIFSLGMSPYPGMNSGEDLYLKLLDGYRMKKPKYATQNVYDIMLSCWRVNPESRPMFDDLEKSISEILDKNVADHYIQLNEPYLQSNVKNFESGKTDYVALMAVPNFQAPSIPDYQNV